MRKKRRITVWGRGSWGIEDVWLKAGEYYYYPKVLGKQESVDFFRTITIPSAWTSEAEGQVLSVEIQAEAVQAANVTPDFTAEAPWGEELEIEQCVHEADNTVSRFSQQSFSPFRTKEQRGI